MTSVYIFSAFTLAFGIYAVMSRSVLRSAIGLALCSASLSMVFYCLGAELVSMFEVSVCSGLVTVMFISGISLSSAPNREIMREQRKSAHNWGLPALLIAAGAIMLLAALLLGGDGLEMSCDIGGEARELLWQSRQADIWGQMAAILCGGVAITVLFREERKEK